MTIAAGFVCKDGLLLCTDRQFTGWEKTQRNKIFFSMRGGKAITFALVGDEDYGKTAMRAARRAVDNSAINDVEGIGDILRDSITAVLDGYSQRTYLDQSQKPQFLIAVNVAGHYKMYSCRDSAFAEVEAYDFRGTGAYIASYMVEGIGFSRDHTTIAETVPLAIRIISAAKRHDAACGGGSQFIAIRHGQTSKVLSYSLDDSDSVIGEFERLSSYLFIAMADSKITEEQARNNLEIFGEAIMAMRGKLCASGSHYRRFSDLLSVPGRSGPKPPTDDPSPPPPSQE